MKDRVRHGEVARGVDAAAKGELLLLVQVGLGHDHLLPVERVVNGRKFLVHL